MNDLQRAIELTKQGNRKEALKIVKSYNKSVSRNFDSLQLEAFLTYGEKRLKEAARLYERVLDIAKTDVQKGHIYKAIGKIFIEDGQNLKAMKSFEAGITYTPNDLDLLHSLMGSYRALSVFDKLEQYGKAIIKHHPNDKETLDHLLHVAIECNKVDDVKLYLSRFLDILEQLTDAHIGRLYSVAVKVSFKTASNYVAEVEGRRPYLKDVLCIFKAELAEMAGDSEKVISLTDGLDTNQFPEWLESGLLHRFRARAFEKLKRFDEAYIEYERMNAISRQRSDGEKDKYVDQYQELNDIFPTGKVEVSADAEFDFTHVFMVGFPRSGTTLLENILNTQENLYTLDEKFALAAVYKGFNVVGKSYPKSLAKLTLKDRTKLRMVYKKALMQHAGDLTKYNVVVDKMPLNIVHLPLIAWLFPDAKILLPIRNPLDCSLSCYSQMFKPNPQMNYFLSLEDTIDRYRQIFSLFEKWESSIPNDLFIYRYEDLVSNFEKIAKDVFNFIGIKPDDKYKEFHLHARERIINTPSRNQVKQAIYQSAKGKWMNYEKYISPHIHLVQPFLEKFNYKL